MMTLLDNIRQRSQQFSDEKLVKAMGYTNIKRGRETLRRLLAMESVYLWLKEGRYDLKYSSKEFLIALCKALGIASDDLDDEIRRALHRLKIIRAMLVPYIFIDTRFVRTSQPIVALALLESRRQIVLEKEELAFKSEHEVFDIISRVVKRHYQDHEGTLKMWGKIHAYVYHHVDGTRKVFNADGSLDESLDVTESKAKLLIDHKEIT